MDVKFNGMGLFTTTKEWIHPEKVEKTSEIIYVTSGKVFLFEEDKSYALNKGDLLILKPETVHRGYKKSFGKTSFYWLHLLGDIPENMYGIIKNFSGAGLFRELIDYANMPVKNENALRIVTEHILLNIENEYEREGKKRLAKEIYEWVRINVNSGLTVEKTADYFGYNSEHISRIIRNEYGIGLKRLIDRFLLDKIKDFLCNTTYSVKEIAAITEFSESSAFINFFKYHEKISPSEYRNKHTEIHMNMR